MKNNFDDEHNCCEEGCDSGCNHEEVDVITLTLEDDSELECAVLGIFEVEDKSYIALVPLEEEQVLLYEYLEKEEGLELGQIENEEKFELVSETFNALFLDDDYDEDDFEEEDED